MIPVDSKGHRIQTNGRNLTNPICLFMISLIFLNDIYRKIYINDNFPYLNIGCNIYIPIPQQPFYSQGQNQIRSAYIFYHFPPVNFIMFILYFHMNQQKSIRRYIFMKFYYNFT